MNPSVIHDPDDSYIRQTFVTFQSLVGIAEEFLKKKKYFQSAVSAQIAALYASYNHHGAFVSAKLEGILRNIGNRTTEEASPSNLYRRNSEAMNRVLHVLTAAKDVGGDTRFVWRWIQRDPGRSHSVALTSQLNYEVPQVLMESVARTGGTCHVLDSEDTGDTNVIRRAEVLRGISEKADVVFLHVYPEDVVPLIAFAKKTNMPPIVFVVQADHQFWLGVSISDLVVHLRESGMLLSEKRRGIKREKMAFLPIPLDPMSLKNFRSKAKERIGCSEDSVVLLSIARAVKYEPIREPGFAEAIVPILNKHKNAVLIVIGPANTNQWMIGHQRTQGRILALGQRSDTQAFYDAADIYLDSFPFGSNTSLLEAGSHGLPLVSYFPYSEDVGVLGAGAPGLDSTVLRVGNFKDYEEIISRLIEDEEFRAQIGQRTKEEIVCMHSGDGWSRCLQEVYRKVAVTPSMVVAWDGLDENRAGELDLLLNRFYSRHVPLGWVIECYTRHLPYTLKLQLLSKMLKVDRSFSFSMFLPNWLGKSVGGRMRGWRHFPGITKWLSVKR